MNGKVYELKGLLPDTFYSEWARLDYQHKEVDKK